MDESIERLAHDIGGSFQSRSKRFAITAARRLAAILAVDVVGYSRLMGEDEAGTAKAGRDAARRSLSDNVQRE